MTRIRKTQKDVGAKLAADHPFYGLIQQAYQVFDYPKPTSTGVCDCCMWDEVEEDFFRPDIDQMPLHYLRDWFFAAADRPLPKSIWAYLLPRVLEVLAAGEELSTVGLEVSLDRFPNGDKDLWAVPEWDILDQFQRQYLQRSAAPSDHYLDDVMCMFARAGWQPEGLFGQVMAWPDAVLTTRLWGDWHTPRGPRIWTTSFWLDEAVPRAFYTSAALCDRMLGIGMDKATPKEISDKALDVAQAILDARG